MGPHGDDLVEFIDDSPLPGPAPAHGRRSWTVLIVDDDEDVHESTRFALRGLDIEERPLRLLHAHSAAECMAVLRAERDVAVVLLDVVMEASDAGLVAVEGIRGELGLHNTRIILRTGQPGQAPEIDTIRRYDINDYKTKSELTRTKLFTSLTAAIRSYAQLCQLDESRRGLEQIVASSHHLMAHDGVQGFAAGVITQIAGLFGIPSEGLVCASASGDPDSLTAEQLRIIAAAGCFSHLVQHPVSEIGDPQIISNLTRCLREQRNLVTETSVTLCFSGHEDTRYAVFIDSPEPLGDVDRELLGVFCTNISLCADNVELVTRLREIAFVDPLLGLPNRSAFVQHLDTAIEADALAGCTIALIDLDQFAETNDMFGHVYGDRLLGAIASRLRKALPGSCSIARVSGDVFAICGDETLVSPAHLAPLFETPYVFDGIERPVSACMGFVRADTGSSAGAELLKDASIALKRAKARGQGEHEFYTSAIGLESRQHTRLLHELQQSFGSDALFLAFQPQLSLESGRVTGVEALLRWRRADGSFVPPDQFIPVAERSGIITLLGNWVMRTALGALAQLDHAGFSDIRMAINVSPAQLRDRSYAEQLGLALQESGVAPGLLELEITESVAVMGMARVSALLAEVKALGVEIAIDDFGTGFSSLSYLDQLPVDRLKIDRSFIALLDSCRPGARIAEMIVPLGHCLGIAVLAEGVETERQAERLRAMGCNEAQGYLYARPMPLDALLQWLQSYRTRVA
ncbi:MAG TPA: EAL domain-containing protein [Thauera sp.]|nr:EAL domain-containing protein [Thauera sp.]